MDELKADIENLEARIDALMRAAGDQWLTQQRADRIRGLVEDVLADADTRAGLLQSSATAGWDKNFFIRSTDGNFELKLSGRLQLRYVYNHQSDPEDGDDHRAGFETRRVRLEVTGHVIDPRLTYAITASFARDGGALELLDAVVNYAIDDHWTLHIGRFRSAIARELEVSSKRQLAADRSPIDTAFPQDRFVGVGLDYEADRFRVMSSFVDATPMLFTDEGWLGSIRGELILWGEGGWKELNDFTSFRDDRPVVMIGAGALYQDFNADTDIEPDTSDLRFTADISGEFSGINMLASVVANQREVDDEQFDQWGVMLQAGVFILEHWEVFGQYLWGDADGQGLDLNAVAAGFNYYISRHDLKLTGDIGYGIDAVGEIWASTGTGWRADPSPDADGQTVVRLQFQLLF
jgi:hypothetical protein